jgi:hypothetical protein
MIEEGHESQSLFALAAAATSLSLNALAGGPTVVSPSDEFDRVTSS